MTFCRYVDSYRNTAVILGGSNEADLKSQMQKSGMKVTKVELAPGEPSDVMYLKQAEHLMKKGNHESACIYLDEALMMNPTSKVNYVKYLSEVTVHLHGHSCSPICRDQRWTKGTPRVAFCAFQFNFNMFSKSSFSSNACIFTRVSFILSINATRGKKLLFARIRCFSLFCDCSLLHYLVLFSSV